MSGETSEQISGWTTDTLHQHVQTQLHDLRTLLDERYATQSKAVEAAFLVANREVASALLSAEKAVTKAEIAADKRFESMNEFRGQLADQASTLMPRSEADVRLAALAEKVQVASARLDLMTGRSGGLDKAWGYVIGAVGLIGSIVYVAVVATRH